MLITNENKKKSRITAELYSSQLINMADHCYKYDKQDTLLSSLLFCSLLLIPYTLQEFMFSIQILLLYTMGFLQNKTLKGIETGKKKRESRMIQFLRRFFKSRERNVEEGRRDKFCFVSSVLQKMCPYWLWRDSRKSC